MIACKNLKLSCYHMARLLADVLANKLLTFLQPIIIIFRHIVLMGETSNIFSTRLIEYIRIYSKFFFKARERLETKNSASASASASRYLKHIEKQTEKMFQLKWRFAHV